MSHIPEIKLVAAEKEKKITEMCSLGALGFASVLPCVFLVCQVGTGGTSLFTPLTGTVSVKVNK